MNSLFIHEREICESAKVGSGTRSWAFAHVLPGAVIGRDCNLCDNVFVEDDVVIGDRVAIKYGVQLRGGVRVEADVFIGHNAILLPGIEIGAGAIVGAGAVVTGSVPPNAG